MREGESHAVKYGRTRATHSCVRPLPGCPSNIVTGNGAGSSLLRTPERLRDCVAAIRAATKPYGYAPPIVLPTPAQRHPQTPLTSHPTPFAQVARHGQSAQRVRRLESVPGESSGGAGGRGGLRDGAPADAAAGVLGGGGLVPHCSGEGDAVRPGGARTAIVAETAQRERESERAFQAGDTSRIKRSFITAPVPRKILSLRRLGTATSRLRPERSCS